MLFIFIIVVDFPPPKFEMLLINVMRTHQFLRLARTRTEEQINLLQSLTISVTPNVETAVVELRHTRRVLAEHGRFLERLQFDWVSFYRALRDSPSDAAPYDQLQTALDSCKANSMQSVANLGQAAERWRDTFRLITGELNALIEGAISNTIPISEAKSEALEVVYQAMGSLDAVRVAAASSDADIGDEWMNIRRELIAIRFSNTGPALSPLLTELTSIAIPGHSQSQDVASLKPTQSASTAAPAETTFVDVITQAPVVDTTAVDFTTAAPAVETTEPLFDMTTAFDSSMLNVTLMTDTVTSDANVSSENTTQPEVVMTTAVEEATTMELTTEPLTSKLKH